MIPKILHSVWFGGVENKPELVRFCEASWARVIPGWTFHETTERNMHEILGPFAEITQAFLERKMWACASTVARILAVGKYGGIYVDSDVQILRPLDPLLEEGCFFAASVGDPDGSPWINTAVIGAETGSVTISELVALMSTKFSDKIDPLTDGPRLLTNNWNKIPHPPKIFPRHYFETHTWTEKDPGPPYPDHHFASHKWLGSWG